MIDLKKENEEGYKDSEFKEHILKLFNRELELLGSSKAYVKDTKQYIVLLSILLLIYLSFNKYFITYRILYDSILLALGFITLFKLDALEFKESKLTKLYEDYLVTNDWELLIDRPDTLIKDRGLELDCDYILYIDKFVSFVLTREQFDELSVLRNIEGCPLIIDLREAVEFENRLKDGEDRYDNSEIYEHYKKR